MPSLLSFFLFLGWILSSSYSTVALAHDPGLSLVDVQLANDKVNVRITYARKDIEQFIQLPNNQNNDLSEAEFNLAKEDLQLFIVDAIEFSAGGVVLKPKINSIEIDKSDAVHFRLDFNTAVNAELTIYSRMIDKFALGHRQFVKVSSEGGSVNSRILSVRDPMSKVNLPKPELWSVFRNFTNEGVWHIWIGFDHILFVITLLLPSVLVLKQGRWYHQHGFNQIAKQTAKVISAFTIAHSLTLSLTVFNLIALPGQIVESMIAASVIFAACNNIYSWIDSKLWMLAFIFGLVHGMGFAAVLHELGLPASTQSLALVGFNIGVELGQLTIVLIILPILYIFRAQYFYKSVFVQSSSYLIAGVGIVWLFERITNTTITNYFI